MAVFQVGKPVLCVETFSFRDQIACKKGEVYILQGISETPCACKATVLDIGAKNRGHFYCGACNFMDPMEITTWWLSTKYFVPLEEDEISDTTFEDIMQEIESTELVEV